MSSLVFRGEAVPGDRERVRAVTRATGFFSTEEVEIAVELVDERLVKGPASGYELLFAERAGSEGAGDWLGYACFGPIPLTRTSWDLYWIAVRPELQGQGIGRALLAETERLVRAHGGDRLYLDTSSRPQYIPTRAFYRGCGYDEAALLPDFYAPGDGKVVHVKILS